MSGDGLRRAKEQPTEHCSDSNLVLPHKKASNPRFCQQCEIDVLAAQLAAANATISRLQGVVSAAQRYKVAVQDPRQDEATFMEWSRAQVGLIAALDRLEADDD